MGDAYTEAFFSGHEPTSLTSARQVVPIVTELVRPRSVVDVGCGHGTWLAAFQECGITDLTGIDGPWVKTAGSADQRNPISVLRPCATVRA